MLVISVSGGRVCARFFTNRFFSAVNYDIIARIGRFLIKGKRDEKTACVFYGFVWNKFGRDGGL